MKIKKEFKDYCVLIAEIVIKKFYQKEFKNDNQEALNIDATIIKVLIEKTSEAISKQDPKFPIEITEDLLIYEIGKKSVLFHIIFNYFQSERDIEKISYDDIYNDWLERKTEELAKEGIEKYLNTSDPHFNHNAYYWHIELRRKNLFNDLEVPFSILAEYLNFKYSINTPFSAVDKVDDLIKKNNLNKEQQLFIYDKINGLIANADRETQEKLSIINVEVLDRRWEIEPLDIQADLDKLNTDLILHEANKIESIYDRIAYLRKKQLEFKNEEDETGFIQEKVNILQIDIDSQYLKLEKERIKNIPDEEYFDKQFGNLLESNNALNLGIQKLEAKIIDKLNLMSEDAKKANQQITKSLDSIEEGIFNNKEEQSKFFDKVNFIIEKLNPKESEEFKGWQNQPLKHKLKVVLPLVILQYEAEMDVSKFSFPKSWKELKEWFINKK